MKCANPLCKAESLYFRSGSLHCIDRFGQRGTHGDGEQIIWLCRDCSTHFIVQTWRPQGQQIRPRTPQLSVNVDDPCRQLLAA